MLAPLAKVGIQTLGRAIRWTAGHGVSLARSGKELTKRGLGNISEAGIFPALRNADLYEKSTIDTLTTSFGSLDGDGGVTLAGGTLLGAVSAGWGLVHSYSSGSTGSQIGKGMSADPIRQSWVHYTESAFSAMQTAGSMAMLNPLGAGTALLGFVGSSTIAIGRKLVGGYNFIKEPARLPGPLQWLVGNLTGKSRYTYT